MSQISTASPITAALMGQITQGRAQKETARSNMAREAIAGQQADLERQRFPLEQARLQAQIDAQRSSADLARERIGMERDRFGQERELAERRMNLQESQFEEGLTQRGLDRELQKELKDMDAQRFKDYQNFQSKEGALDRDMRMEIANLSLQKQRESEERSARQQFEMMVLQGNNDRAGDAAQTERLLLQSGHMFDMSEATKGRNEAMTILSGSLSDFTESWMEDSVMNDATTKRMQQIMGDVGSLGEVAVAYDTRTLFGIIPTGEQTLGSAVEMDFYEVAKRSGMTSFEAQSFAERAQRAMQGMGDEAQQGQVLSQFMQDAGISVDEDNLIRMGVSEAVAERVSKTAAGDTSGSDMFGEGVDRYQKRDMGLVMDRFLVRIAKGMAAEDGFVGVEHQGLLYQAMNEVVSGGGLSAETAEQVKAAGIGSVLVNTLKAAKNSLGQLEGADGSLAISGVEIDSSTEGEDLTQGRQIMRSFREDFDQRLTEGVASLVGDGTAASIGYISSDVMEEVIGELTQGVRRKVDEDELLEVLTQIPDGEVKDQLLQIILDYSEVPEVDSRGMREELLEDLRGVDENLAATRASNLESARGGILGTEED